MPTPSSGPPWHNWARTAVAVPTRRERPRDEDEVVDAVRRAAVAGLRVRAVGAGHSFSPVAVTDGVQLQLDALDRLERVERLPDGSAHVTVGAGIRLAALNRLLAGLGLAMETLGDIDQQSLAGAVSTGTHGTGLRWGGMASQVVGLRLVTADGAVVDVGPGDGLFEVARLGLGSVGVVVTVTVRVLPAFALRAREEPWALPDVLANLGPDGWPERTDHVDLYWFPFTQRVHVKRYERLPGHEPARPGPWARARGWVDDELLSNGVFEVTNRLAARAPGLVPRINAVTARALAGRTYTAPSAEVFVSRRGVVFRETEYAVPRDAVVDVLTELDGWLRRTGEPVPFPLEVRFTGADDVWLSTAHDRTTAYVAVQQFHRMPHARYFDAFERIVAAVDGRPHWGKLHGLDAGRLRELYPRFDDVRDVRSRHDPEGRFGNDYVDRVLGPV